jgi:hypothetical protein
MRPRSSVAKLLLVVAAVAMLGCASSLATTWTEPSAKGASLSKVAVVCMTPDPGLRRIAEDSAAFQLVGAQAVASYRILGDTNPNDRDAVEGRLRQLGFQGVLVMRFARVAKRVNPALSGGFGYYGTSSSPVAEPPDLQASSVLHVVSDLYALPEGRLIWSGVSRTFDPASASADMANVSKAVAKSIQKDRLVL